jgi:hypothetical protein
MTWIDMDSDNGGAIDAGIQAMRQPGMSPSSNNPVLLESGVAAAGVYRVGARMAQMEQENRCA